MRAPPPEPEPNLSQVLSEIREELAEYLGRRPRRDFPPGETWFSARRTHRFQRETLQVLLELYAEYGPVFSLRSLHRPIVALIGAEANHFVTVSGAANFSWRKGMFGEQLGPLIGDGLITTDGPYHDKARAIMMPAFHRRRMDDAVGVMNDEAERALEGWRPGERIDLYAWVRQLAMSIAMRAVLGLDPRDEGSGARAAELFEAALAYYDTETWMMLLRGPGSPWARLQANRRALDEVILAQIDRRTGSEIDRPDVLSMLLEARDEDGDGFTAPELRDQVMHLLFGGHDTTSSTLSFLMLELARHPHVLQAVVEEQDAVLAGRAPTTEDLISGLPYLSMVVDETLRLYPPVWFGPRMSVAPFSFGGYEIPAGVHIIHSSWVTHRLPELYPDPEAFLPERFSPEARRRLPPGAYIPFGAGSRICIGKRFGQLMVKAIATNLLQRVRPELQPGFELRIGKMPTLSPEGGLPVTVRPRATPGDRVRAEDAAGVAAA